jgi:hypothetical protein
MGKSLQNIVRCDDPGCTYTSLCLEFFDYGVAGLTLSIGPRMEIRDEKSTITTNR